MAQEIDWWQARNKEAEELLPIVVVGIMSTEQQFLSNMTYQIICQIVVNWILTNVVTYVKPAVEDDLAATNSIVLQSEQLQVGGRVGFCTSN